MLDGKIDIIYPENSVYNCLPTIDKGLAIILILITLYLHWTDNKCLDYIFFVVSNIGY